MSAVTAMILLSPPSQAAEILNRGLDVPLNCLVDKALPLRVYYRDRRWLGADATQGSCKGQSPGASDSRIGAENGSSDSRGPVKGLSLSNDQLDNVAAGLAARATGDAHAEGALASSTAEVTTIFGQPGPQNASSIGQAIAAAAGPSAAGPATASSTLTLTVAVP